MVVIAASGGGSHAARWTTEVLSGCTTITAGCAILRVHLFRERRVGRRARCDVRARGLQKRPTWSGALEQARDAASRSNVGALAWGLIYPDLVRKIIPWLFDARRDRGWALEQAWRSKTRRVFACGDTGILGQGGTRRYKAGGRVQRDDHGDRQAPADFTRLDSRNRCRRVCGAVPGPRPVGGDRGQALGGVCVLVTDRAPILAVQARRRGV